MPRGPFGFPRVTDVGPFVDEDVSQRFVRDNKGDKTHIFPEDKEIIKVFSVDENTITTIKSRLEVDRESKKDEASGVLGAIKEEVEELRFPKEVAHIRYWYSQDSGIAKVEGTVTEEDFTRMGIAKTLRQRELEHLKDLGIDLVFTDVVSGGGYNLAKSTGAKPIDEMARDTGYLEFDHELNRGIMFNRL